MELLEGRTLGYLINRKPLGIESVLDLGIQISDALNAAHKQGIIHRDCISFASPKSRTLACSPWVTKILAGLVAPSSNG